MLEELQTLGAITKIVFVIIATDPFPKIIYFLRLLLIRMPKIFSCCSTSIEQKGMEIYF
jgi:hypothetical protein